MNRLSAAFNNLANQTTTENGAVTNKNTGSACLDLFSRGGAMRTSTESDIKTLVDRALAENKTVALKALFYLRDVRGGQGERRFFRVAMKHIAAKHPEMLVGLLQHVPTFGRFDDLFIFEETPLAGQAMALIGDQLLADTRSDRPSLLAKWMPSLNTSSSATRKLARVVSRKLGFTPRGYRKTLSTLRSKLNLVETLMSCKEWSAINYSHVPSQAGLKYRKAFRNRDGVRYSQFLSDASRGKVKINTKTLTPVDIVGKVMMGQFDDTLQVAWDNLPNYMEGAEENSLVIADVSGSMSGTPMNVAISLAMYIAERNKGHFHNMFMTFSSNPAIQLIQGNNLQEKVRNLSRAEWGMSTDLEKALLLILSTAVENKLYQEELPKTLYIVSDMEFNACVQNSKLTNLQNAAKLFSEAGYTIPEIVFWNVNSRNQQSPATKDDKGVYLVSGYNPSILKSLLSKTSVTPFDLMMEILNSERYSVIT